MKSFFAFILLNIALAAAFIPCCSFDNCEEEFSLSQNKEGNEEKGSCSPFSTCTSCSGSVLPAKSFQVLLISECQRLYNEPLNFALPSKYYSTFWQPPRLS